VPPPVDGACLPCGPEGEAWPQCAYCRGGDGIPGRPAAPGGTLEPGWLAHLYLHRGLSTYAIADAAGVERQRVNRALRKAGVPLRARGAGRLRPERRLAPADVPNLPALMRALYVDARLDSGEIAAILGMPGRTVRDRLRRYGIKARTRGGYNREDRTTVPAEVLQVLYVELGLSAAEVGRRLGLSRSTVLRSAHALGVPVRSGGMVPLPGPEEIELVSALYADPLISAVLTAHDLPRVPPGGSLSQRFPEPLALTTPLVKDLYWGCGAGLDHIELLTGQPSESVRKFMRRAGIPLRHPGGRTPFLRRWRSGPPGGAPRGPSGGPRHEPSAVRPEPAAEAGRASTRHPH
jgi:hypothetical protein